MLVCTCTCLQPQTLTTFLLHSHQDFRIGTCPSKHKQITVFIVECPVSTTILKLDGFTGSSEQRRCKIWTKSRGPRYVISYTFTTSYPRATTCMNHKFYQGGRGSYIKEDSIVLASTNPYHPQNTKLPHLHPPSPTCQSSSSPINKLLHLILPTSSTISILQTSTISRPSPITISRFLLQTPSLSPNLMIQSLINRQLKHSRLRTTRRTNSQKTNVGDWVRRSV